MVRWRNDPSHEWCTPALSAVEPQCPYTRLGGPALLDTVTGSAPELIFAKDRAGRMPRAKEPTRAVIGRTLTEILGQTIVEFADDSPDARTVMANDQRVMSLAVTEHM